MLCVRNYVRKCSSYMLCYTYMRICMYVTYFLVWSVYFAVTGTGIIFVILPSLHDITQHWFLNAGR